MARLATGAAEQDSRSKLLAWLVHLFTASGVLFALLSIQAIHQERWSAALLWLLVALAVDGIDGTLARATRVKTVLPRIDGDILDLVIDYLNFVLVPTLFMWRAGLLPPGWEFPLAAAIQLSSLYVFARRDMKTDDGYFRGFPGLWNVVAVYVFITTPGALVAAITIVALVAATFAPIHFVHPFRVTDYGRWLLAIAALWAVSTAALLIPGLGPAVTTPLLVTSLVTAALLVGLGLLRSLKGPRPANGAGTEAPSA